MERVLLHENEGLLFEICKDLKQYLPHLEQLKKTYENLKLGDFDNKVLTEIVKSGTVQIEKRFNKSLNNQIDQSGISNSILRENILKGSERLFFEFSEKTKELKRFKPTTYSRNNYLKLNVISFENDTFYLSKENKEEILENECRIYIENEKELELYNNLQNFIAAYDKVNENLEELKFSFRFEQGKGVMGVANVFLRMDDKHYSLRPETLKAVVNYRENSLRFTAKSRENSLRFK